MTNSILKIFAVSLVGNKKYKAGAVYNDEKGLVIASLQPIGGIFGSWRQPLVDEVKMWVDSGAVVLVEENGDAVSQHATQFLLEDMDGDSGKTNMALALDAYFQLEDSDYLIIPQEYQRYALKAGNEGSWIEKKNDDKGRPYYSIDWSKFTGAHRAILLCVAAAMFEPLSGRFLDAMWGKQGENIHIDNPIERWKKIFKDRGNGLESYLMEERSQT